MRLGHVSFICGIDPEIAPVIEYIGKVEYFYSFASGWPNLIARD
jgi:hypothetical protein